MSLEYSFSINLLKKYLFIGHILIRAYIRTNTHADGILSYELIHRGETRCAFFFLLL